MSKLFRKSPSVAVVCATLSAIVALIGCTQTTTISATVSQQSGVSATVTHVIKWDPPGSYLVNFDATKALLQLSLTNAKVASTTGSATVSVKDLTTGQIVGQQSFGYVISGTSVYAQDPSAVYNWLQQFTGYADIEVTTNLATLLQSVDSTSSSSAVSTAQYQGTNYASGSVGWEPTTNNCTTDPGGFTRNQLCGGGGLK
jgi:hypothetical protein